MLLHGGRYRCEGSTGSGRAGGADGRFSWPATRAATSGTSVKRGMALEESDEGLSAENTD